MPKTRSGIHHVGSSAVPGLEAKPTIDVLVGVEDVADSRDRLRAEPVVARE